MLSQEVMAILCCPDDGSALTLGGESLVAQVNDMIHGRQLRNRAGQLVEHSLDGGLINANANMLYPIIEGIPVLVRDEAIPLNQVDLVARDKRGARPGSQNSL